MDGTLATLQGKELHGRYHTNHSRFLRCTKHELSNLCCVDSHGIPSMDKIRFPYVIGSLSARQPEAKGLKVRNPKSGDYSVNIKFSYLAFNFIRLTAVFHALHHACKEHFINNPRNSSTMIHAAMKYLCEQ